MNMDTFCGPLSVRINEVCLYLVVVSIQNHFLQLAGGLKWLQFSPSHLLSLNLFPYIRNFAEQCCKKVIELTSSFSYLSFQEFLRSTVDIADLVGLHLVMTRIAGKGELKVLVAGVGMIRVLNKSQRPAKFTSYMYFT